MTEAEFDIITIADTCVDLVVDLGDVLPQFGQVEQWVPGYFLEMGGSACIFACQAARLGMKVGILGRVGADDFGELMLNRMRECGVDVRYMQVDPAVKTGLGVALNRPSGDRAILTYGGSLNAVYPQDLTDEFLLSGRHFHYCSYYLQTNLLPHIPAIAQRAKALGLTLSLDTNWDPQGSWNGGLATVLSSVDVFFPNGNEAMAVSGRDSLPAALAELARRVPLVAAKLGEQGCRVVTRDDDLEIPVEVVPNPVDTIGAGDCFDAGFLAGWLRGLPIAECAAIGNACGRATTLAPGGVLGQLTWESFSRLNPASY